MNRTQPQKMLYGMHNTFVNEARSSTFVDNQAGGDATVANNLFFGNVNPLKGDGEASSNVREQLAQRVKDSWAAPHGSAAINGAAQFSSVGGVSLLPGFEFTPPIGTRQRQRHGPLDVGSHEASP